MFVGTAQSRLWGSLSGREGIGLTGSHLPDKDRIILGLCFPALFCFLHLATGGVFSLSSLGGGKSPFQFLP